MLSEGGLAFLYRLGICENLKENGWTRIVKPPFWCWSWEPRHLACPWQAPARPQENYCGATPNTGIQNPARHREEGISQKDHHLTFVSSRLLEASHSKYVTNCVPEVGLQRWNCLFLPHYNGGDNTFKHHRLKLTYNSHFTVQKGKWNRKN